MPRVDGEAWRGKTWWGLIKPVLGTPRNSPSSEIGIVTVNRSHQNYRLMKSGKVPAHISMKARLVQSLHSTEGTQFLLFLFVCLFLIYFFVLLNSFAFFLGPDVFW